MLNMCYTNPKSFSNLVHFFWTSIPPYWELLKPVVNRVVWFDNELCRTGDHGGRVSWGRGLEGRGSGEGGKAKGGRACLLAAL